MLNGDNNGRIEENKTLYGLYNSEVPDQLEQINEAPFEFEEASSDYQPPKAEFGDIQSSQTTSKPLNHEQIELQPIEDQKIQEEPKVNQDEENPGQKEAQAPIQQSYVMEQRTIDPSKMSNFFNKFKNTTTT